MKIQCALAAALFYLASADAACETEEASLTTCLTSNSCDTDLDLAYFCINCITEATSYNACTVQNGGLTFPPAIGDITIPPALGDVTLPPFGDITFPPFGDITFPPFGDITFPPAAGDLTFPPVDIPLTECVPLVQSYFQCWFVNSATCFTEVGVSCLAEDLNQGEDAPSSCQELTEEAAKCSCSACDSQLQDLLDCYCDGNPSSSPAFSLMNAAIVMVAVSAAILL